MKPKMASKMETPAGEDRASTEALVAGDGFDSSRPPCRFFLLVSAYFCRRTPREKSGVLGNTEKRIITHVFSAHPVVDAASVTWATRYELIRTPLPLGDMDSPDTVACPRDPALKTLP